MAKPKLAGIGAKPPGPAGFRAAGARCVGRLARCAASRCACLLTDRRTARKQNCFNLAMKGSKA
jgi:hypothetical protein